VITPVHRISFCLVLVILSVKPSFSQQEEALSGFWESRITYECSWGWKDESGSVLLSKDFGWSYKGMVFGGNIEISHAYDDEYNFEITGQSECYRKGKLTRTEFGGKIYLSGEWTFTGGNNAMWGTGLCCNGKIELYRESSKEKKLLATTREPGKTAYIDTVNSHSHIKLEAGKKFILKTVLFKLSSDELLPEGYPEIDFLAKMLKENPTTVIRLEGHTDIDGPKRMNKKLSKKRVKQVRSFLVNRGINKKRIKLKWYGAKKPLIKRGTVEQRKVNRRVEVRVLKV